MLQLRKGLKLECLRLPFKRALETAAELGAEGVEINGRSDLRPAELSRTGVRHLKKMLGDLNLSVAAVHFPTRRGYDESEDLDRRLDATKAAMTMAYDLGCSVVTNRIGFVEEEISNERRSTMTQALTDLGMFSQKSGAWLAAQSGFEAPSVLRQLIDSLPPMAIGVDFDPATFVINGFSSTEGMKVLAEHVMHFRARDAVHDLSLGRGLEVQLGPWLGRITFVVSDAGGTALQRFFSRFERDAQADAVIQCGQAIEYLDNLFA